MSDRCIICGSEKSTSYTIEKGPTAIDGHIWFVTRRFYCDSERCLAYRELELAFCPHRKIQEISPS